MELLPPGRQSSNKGLRLGLVEVLTSHWPSSEGGGLLRGQVTSLSSNLTIVVGVRLLELLACSIGIGSRERLVLNLLDHVRVFMDHVKLWLSNNIIIEVN